MRHCAGAASPKPQPNAQGLSAGYSSPLSVQTCSRPSTASLLVSRSDRENCPRARSRRSAAQPPRTCLSCLPACRPALVASRRLLAPPAGSCFLLLTCRPPTENAPMPLYAVPSFMATIAELVAALEALPQHFSALAPSVHAAERAESAAELLCRVQSVSPAAVSQSWDTALERCAAAGIATLVICKASQLFRRVTAAIPTAPLGSLSSAGQWRQQRTAWLSWQQWLLLPWLSRAMCHSG